MGSNAVVRALLVLATVIAVTLVGASRTGGAPGVQADDCGTFEVTPGDGSTGLHPVRYVIVFYTTCFPGGIASISISVDGEHAGPIGGASANPSPPILGLALGYPKRPLLPGTHTAVARVGEKECPTCPSVVRTYTWAFTVGGKGEGARPEGQ